MTTNTTKPADIQAVSIDTPEFRQRLRGLRDIRMQETMDIELNEICDDIDAKLAHAYKAGWISMESAACNAEARNADEWRARATAAEAQLAAIRTGAESIEGWKDVCRRQGVHESYEPEFMCREIVALRAILQPQAQCDTSGLPG